MRKPTPESEALKWWRQALEGVSPPPINEQPECGFYERRLVKGGPLVPVAIWLEQAIDAGGYLLEPEIIRCVVNGKLDDAVNQWGYCCASPITKARYHEMRRKIEFERDNPDSHLINPRQRIDLLTVQPPTFNKREKAK